MDKEKLYVAALEKWGVNTQINMAIEEMSELIQALLKHRRCVFDPKLSDNICEEIADVEIMMEQLRMLFYSNKIDTIKEAKLERLQAMIEES